MSTFGGKRTSGEGASMSAFDQSGGLACRRLAPRARQLGGHSGYCGRSSLMRTQGTLEATKKWHSGDRPAGSSNSASATPIRLASARSAITRVPHVGQKTRCSAGDEAKRGRARHAHLIDRIEGTGEERRAHRLLAQPAMADPHVSRLTTSLEAHLAAEAATLTHGFVWHGDLLSALALGGQRSRHGWAVGHALRRSASLVSA